MNLIADCNGKKLANDLQWLHEPLDWEFDNTGLRIVPHAPSDFFRPGDGPPNDNGALLYKHVTGNFTAVTQVTADLCDFGDAAALTVRAGESLWAKICLERSPTGEIAIVSVVTNPWSDDSNNELLTSPACYMRLTRKGDIFAMHYSLEGKTWRFVRTFTIAMPPDVMVGIHAQAPFTGGCQVLFHSLTLSPEPVADFRSGE
jgi:hypothetical protein